MAGKDDDKDGKGGPEAGDTGMDLQEMKAMLKRAQKAPVKCALGRSGSLGLLLMDRIKQPKALMKELKDKFADIRTPVFGTASVDKGTDAKLVTFAVNKRVPGLDRRIRKTLKGTGYTKVALEAGAAGEE